LSKVQVDTIDTRSGTSTMQIGSTNTSTINIGVSGDTVNIPAGVTIANAGTATGFGQSMTPMFAVRRTSGQTVTDNSFTKIQFATEDIDTDSAFDNSSNYRFTVPSGKAGKYLFSFNVAVASNTGVSNAQQLFVALYKNGTSFLQNFFDGRNNAYGDTFSGSASFILDCSASDYFEIYAKFNDGGSGNGGNVQSGAASFSGVRLLAS